MNVSDLTPAMMRAVAGRLIVPGLVLLVVGGILISATAGIENENRRLLAKIGSIVWQIDKIDTHIADLAGDVNVVLSQDRRYKNIQQRGFVGEQSRLRAAQLLEELGPKYQLTALHYDFMPPAIDAITGGEGTRFRLVRTDLSLEIEAMTDTQLLGFVAEFTERLSGLIQIQSLRIERLEDLSPDVVEQIAAGERPALFQADVLLSWNNVTVVVDETVSEDDHGALDEDRDSDTDRS